MAWTTPKTWAELETLTSADMNLHLKDNLDFLRSKLAATPNQVFNTFTGTNPTIASGTFADVQGGLNIASFTPQSASSLIQIGLVINISPSAGPSDNLSFDINIDGSRIGDATYGLWLIQSGAAANHYPLHLMNYTTLSATAHSIKPQWRRDGSTTWTARASLGNRIIFYVRDLGPIAP